MAKRKAIPKYGTVIMGGIEYYRTRIKDADGKRVALYGRTREELYDKVQNAKREIEACTFRRESPTVKEYCEKWLLMQSAHAEQIIRNELFWHSLTKCSGVYPMRLNRTVERQPFFL